MTTPTMRSRPTTRHAGTRMHADVERTTRQHDRIHPGTCNTPRYHDTKETPMRVAPQPARNTPFDPALRPPLDALPEPIKALAIEYDTLHGRQNSITSRLQDEAYWFTQREAARKADGAAAIAAIRAETEHKNPTEHGDAVDAERARLEHERDSIVDAIRVVQGELGAAREAEWTANRATYAKALATKRKALEKAAAAALEAGRAAAPALAMMEWLSSRHPYTESTTLSLLTVAPTAGNLGPSAAGITVTLEQLAGSIADLVGAEGSEDAL